MNKYVKYIIKSKYIKYIIKTLYKIILPFVLLFFRLFYKKEFLKGKQFENSYIGLIWCLKGILWQKIFRINPHFPWPVSPFIKISNWKNIEFHPDDLGLFQGFGNYYQNFAAKIIIGKGSYIAPNVGIITANHDVNNLDKHLPGKDVIIGKNCWIGMNSVILPGIILGDNTIVGAGSIVTKSFPQGHCVIAGNPAKIIKYLEKK